MDQISNLKQLFSISEDKLNILEEEIDVQVQKEYFSLLNKLSKDTNAYTQLTKTYIENINDLFDDAKSIYNNTHNLKLLFKPIKRPIRQRRITFFFISDFCFCHRKF